jgi:hypothetical protein
MLNSQIVYSQNMLIDWSSPSDFDKVPWFLLVEDEVFPLPAVTGDIAWHNLYKKYGSQKKRLKSVK